MKAASVHEIKQELKDLPSPQLVDICLRLARYKKENKELLTFLLFEANDLEGYIKSIKEEINESFEDVNKANMYQAKKTLRKILRTANKYIRFSGSKIAEVEILIYFCTQFHEFYIPYYKSTALENLYNSQIKKIRATIDTLHEDLQHDYLRQVEKL
jgi:hypothetical protein